MKSSVVPEYVSHLLFSTPGRMGQSLEYFVDYATNDSMTLVRTVRALASATRAHVTQLDEQGMSTAAAQDLEYHWTQLNSLVLSGVAPNQEEHTYYWIRLLVQEEGLAAAVVDALTRGATYLRLRGDQRGWPHDTWESTISTEQIVEWFQLRCEAEHRRQAARDW